MLQMIDDKQVIWEKHISFFMDLKIQG